MPRKIKKKNKGKGRVRGDNYKLMLLFSFSLGFDNVASAMVNGPRRFRNDFNQWISKKTKREINKLHKQYKNLN